MLSFLSRMRLPGFGQDDGDDDNDQAGLPLPATHKYQDRPGHRRGDSASSLATLKDGKPLPLNTLTISAPIPRSSPSSITGFDNDIFYPASGGGSSSASVSSGSMVTAYQYQPTSFSALHQYQQQQQSSGVGHQSQNFYQNPGYSRSVIQLQGPALSRAAPEKGWISSDDIGVAIGGEGDLEEEDMTELSLADQERMARYADSQFPAVIRLDSGDYSYVHEDSREYAADQIGRSASAPPSGVHVLQQAAQYQQNPQYAIYGLDSSVPGNPSVIAGGPSLFDLRLNLDANAQFAQSVQSLRLVDHIAAASATDVFGGAYDYPRAKQLSPIAEVEYVSPDSLKKTKSLPFMSHFPSDVSFTAYSRQNTNNTNTTNISPGGASQGSEVTRPSPVYSSPFITRPLNRTVSQTSSRTHISTASSVPTRVTTATMKAGDPAPTLPPLDLKPPFPGPHPSQSGTLRPSKPQRTFGGLSTIVGSDEGGAEGSKYTSDDVASLHADSFVTASTRSYDNEGGVPPSIPGDEDYGDDEGESEKDEKLAPGIHSRQLSASGETLSDLTSVHSGRSRIRSGSESFIARRWESDAGYGSGGRVAVLRTKKKAWLDATPAFWSFWLGFVCPFLWLVGGWHFTNFGEQPSKLSFWEFYFNTGYWRFQLKSCFERRKKGIAEPDERQEEDEKRARFASKGKDKQQDPPPVTRWVAEKQSSEQRRERLYDPKRSMRGILFGYPFIARPMRHERKKDWAARALGRLIQVIAVPNRLFDHLYGVKLTEVRGRPETSRRMFDPWIQRCRYAFCYALIVLSIGLCITSTYLIIYNTRQLRA